MSTIQEQAEPCWMVRDADGSLWGENEPQHYLARESAEDAARHATDMAAEDADEYDGQPPEYRAEQEPDACWIATCAECGDRCEEDGAALHAFSADQAAESARGEGWTGTPERLICPRCQAEATS